MISLRKAKTVDLGIIQDFNNKLCAKEHHDFDLTINPNFAKTEEGESYFKSSIESEKKLVLIAEDEGKPVGYIIGGTQAVGDFRNMANMCEADNMWVDESYRSRGIGKQLMDGLEAWAKEKGIKRMRVLASSKNEKGINFYKREGFREYDLILEKDL